MEKVFTDIRGIVEKMAFVLYDVLFETRDGDNVLSVLIDHENGIDIDDCVQVSEAVSLYLDQEDPIDQTYTLEVASAGAERLLRNHEERQAAIGRFIYIETETHAITGTLKHATTINITIKDKNNKTHTVLLSEINLIRLAIDF